MCEVVRYYIKYLIIFLLNIPAKFLCARSLAIRAKRDVAGQFLNGLFFGADRRLPGFPKTTEKVRLFCPKIPVSSPRSRTAFRL